MPATVTGPWARGEAHATPVECKSGISGLQVPALTDGQFGLEMLRASNGRGLSIPDEEIWRWQTALMEREGIYSEPAGAAALAGLAQARKQGWIQSEDHIVCLVTGHGFKDLQSIETAVAERPVPLIEVEEL